MNSKRLPYGVECSYYKTRSSSSFKASLSSLAALALESFEAVLKLRHSSAWGEKNRFSTSDWVNLPLVLFLHHRYLPKLISTTAVVNNSPLYYGGGAVDWSMNLLTIINFTAISKSVDFIANLSFQRGYADKLNTNYDQLRNYLLHPPSLQL